MNFYFTLHFLITSIFQNQYSLEEFYNEFYFYNSTILNGNIVYGTNQGVVIKDGKEFFFINENLIGVIKNIDGKLEEGDYTNDFKHYTYLLPQEEVNLASNCISYNNRVHCISNGKLYIYNKIPFDFQKLPSVRAISENFIGTYGGIIDSNTNSFLDFPGHTDSFIREIDEKTYICWGGLTIIDKDGLIQNYYNSSSKSIIIGGQSIGEARDIFRLDEYFILFTDRGIYLVDFTNNYCKSIFSYQGEIFKIYQDVNDNSKNSLIFFGTEEFIYSINNQYEINKIFTSKNKIIDATSSNGNNFYVIIKDKLLEFDINNKTQNVLLEAIKDPLNVIKLNDYLLITKNSGLDIIRLTDREYIKDLVVDEFNKKAFHKNSDNLALGSTRGLYKLNQKLIDDVFMSKLTLKNPNKGYFYSNTLVKNISFAIIFIFLFLLLFIYNQRKKINDLKKPEVSKDLIVKFINENLKTASISILKDNFNLSTNRLYEIFENNSPGKYISSRRKSLLFELYKQKKPIEEIMESTGLSEIYIKKIIREQFLDEHKKKPNKT